MECFKSKTSTDTCYWEDGHLHIFPNIRMRLSKELCEIFLDWLEKVEPKKEDKNDSNSYLLWGDDHDGCRAYINNQFDETLEIYFGNDDFLVFLFIDLDEKSELIRVLRSNVSQL